MVKFASLFYQGFGVCGGGEKRGQGKIIHGRARTSTDSVLGNVKSRKGQMKIMQMSFMIIGVFFFFVLVGLFVLGIMLKDVRGGAEDLAKARAISSIEVIAGMSELSYDSDWSMSVDEDKLRVLSSGFGERMNEFWPVASVEVYKVYPVFGEVVECPGVGCNYYSVYDPGQRDVERFSSYVSICERVKEFGSVYDRCEVGKIVVGTVIRESEVGGR